MSTYRSLPEVMDDDSIKERIAKLMERISSLDMHCYEVGAAVQELRKEVTYLNNVMLRKVKHWAQ